MQRLYSMFPQGGPGIGLVLVRLAVGAVFLLNVTVRFGFSTTLFRTFWVILIALVSISLAIGFLTPFLSAVAGLTAFAHLLLADPSFIDVFAILNAGALALLGPGAYSLDARLFGLRVTVVRPRRDGGEKGQR